MNATEDVEMLEFLGLRIRNYQLVAFIILAISSLGFVCNVIVAFYTHTLPSMNNAFGKLTACQSTACSIGTGLFVVYVFPMILLAMNSGDVLHHSSNERLQYLHNVTDRRKSQIKECNNKAMVAVSKHFGFVFTICYDVGVWSHLFISSNRFCAICFPNHYEYYFSERNTKIMMILAWIFPIMTSIVLFRLLDCDCYFSDYYWSFVFSSTEICMWIAWHIDFKKTLTFVLIVSSLDIITIYRVHATTRELALGTAQQQQRRKIEVNFLKQAVIQGVTFTIELWSYFYFAWMFKSRYMVFLLTTFIWQFLHFTDALIILTFNGEFRRLVTQPFRSLHSREDLKLFRCCPQSFTTSSITPISGAVTSQAPEHTQDVTVHLPNSSQIASEHLDPNPAV